jgi:hypothetical protein
VNYNHIHFDPNSTRRLPAAGSANLASDLNDDLEFEAVSLTRIGDKKLTG